MEPFCQFNKSLTRNKQHALSRFTRGFAGLKTFFTPLSKSGIWSLSLRDFLRLPEV
jgi:hypothetical protein